MSRIVQYTDCGMYSKEKKEGLFASIPPRAFVFIPAPALGTEEEIASWQRQADVRNTDALAKVIPSLRSGLQKQYDIQKKLFADPHHPQAE